MIKRVAVVGSGISGLAAAWKLSGTPHEVHIFESEPTVGGKLQTRMIDGFLVESAADSFVASRPRIVELTRELGLEQELIQPRPGKRAYIYHDQQMHEIPEGFSGLVPTRLKPLLKTKLLTPMGKLRLLAETRVTPKVDDEDEPLRAFAVRRFGQEAYDRLFEPLMAGVSASGGDNISVQAAFPHWRTAELEYGSVMRGILAQDRARTSNPRVSGFLSFRSGMGTLVRAMTDRLQERNVQFHLSSPVTAMQPATDGYSLNSNGTTHLFDGVVIALPGPAAATLCHGFDPDLGDPIQHIGYGTSVVVSLGYHDTAVRERLMGTGYLTPTIEGREATGTTFSSEKWEGRAPEGSSLIRVFIGRNSGSQIEAATEADLVMKARSELEQSVGITAEPDLMHVTRWRNSTPEFAIGHLKKVEAIELQLGGHNGLAICGCELRGVGIPVCVVGAEVAAQHVIDNLAQ